MADHDFLLFRNTPLADAATSGATYLENEPSVGNNGQLVFMTGNTHASVSSDGGSSWNYIDPYSTFPNSHGGFCCDQVVLYDARHDLMFWLLQYGKDATTNIHRLAVATSANVARNSWYYYDFSPPSVGGWTGEWFDFPDLALTNDFLFFTSNVYQVSDNAWTRGVVARLPISELASRSALNYSQYSLTSHGSFKCVQGASNTMYFASHNATGGSFQLFSWPDNSNWISSSEIQVSPWADVPRSAPGPDGLNWMGKSDRRMTGAWVSGEVAGFLWTAAQNGSSRPFPYVKVARVNLSTMTLIDQPDIWSTACAYSYPAAAVNSRGDVGLSLFYGGGSYYPSHSVAINDDYSTSYPWAMVTTAAGTNGPDNAVWGDYLACRPHIPSRNTWIATGFSLQGGSTRREIEPRYVHFGRRRDTP